MISSRLPRVREIQVKTNFSPRNRLGYLKNVGKFWSFDSYHLIVRDIFVKMHMQLAGMKSKAFYVRF